jgi:hypothetical protein
VQTKIKLSFIHSAKYARRRRMKTLTEWNVKNFDTLLDDESFEVVDWKEKADEVLKSVDALLKPFGLEVIMRDAQDDSYHFKIGRRE